MPAGGRRSLLRNPLAWTVTLFFGCQAFMAYIVMGWLPQVFIDDGVGKTQAGLLVGLMSLVGVPIAPAHHTAGGPQRQPERVDRRARRDRAGGGRRPAGGARRAPLLWSLLIGVGMSAFSMALAVIALRARNAEDTAQLSGMAQGLGYLIAGTGPFLFGLLHDVSDGWTVPWVMFLVVYVVQIVAGAAAGRNRYV